jgi:hypothetical protein
MSEPGPEVMARFVGAENVERVSAEERAVSG